MLVRLRHLTSIAAMLAAGLFALTASAAGPSSSFEVRGAVTHPSAFDAAALEKLTPFTQTDSFSAGNSGVQTHTYTGAKLWDVVNRAGLVLGSNKNDVLKRYVLATGSDGYRTVFSLGELDPSFGNKPYLAAYSETIGGVTAPLSSDGFARVTAPGDAKGGRYVSNLIDLTVRSSGSTKGSTSTGPTDIQSTEFSVSGGVTSPATFDLAALQKLKSTTEVVGGHTYVGVSFWDFLNSDVGLVLDPQVKNDVLSKYVVTTGKDGYKSLFSLGELDPAFGGQPDLIAYSVDGVSLGNNGFARIVVPTDVKAGRWVSDLTSIEVFSAVAAVPEPGSYALMLAGLVAVGFSARKKLRPLPA